MYYNKYRCIKYLFNNINWIGMHNNLCKLAYKKNLFYFKILLIYSMHVTTVVAKMTRGPSQTNDLFNTENNKKHLAIVGAT